MIIIYKLNLIKLIPIYSYISIVHFGIKKKQIQFILSFSSCHDEIDESLKSTQLISDCFILLCYNILSTGPTVFAHTGFKFMVLPPQPPGCVRCTTWRSAPPHPARLHYWITLRKLSVFVLHYFLTPWGFSWLESIL